MGSAKRITLRSYLTIKVVMMGFDHFTTAEAISSTALEHPEWDMDEERTFQEWEERHNT